MSRLGLTGWTDGLHPIQGIRQMAGRARTLLYGPRQGGGGRTESLYETIEAFEPGDVLVIGTGGTSENLLGDRVAGFAQNAGLAAIVTDSMVRDAAGLRALSMPVFARGTTARLRQTLEPVALDVPLLCAGALVRPGDIMVGGEDGLVVFPAVRLADVLYQLEDIVDFERDFQGAIEGRKSAADIRQITKRKKILRKQV